MTNTQNDSHAHVRNLQTLGHCPACTDDSHADGNDSRTKAIAALGAVEVAPFTFAWQNADGWWTLDHKYIRILFNYIHGHAPLEPLSKKQLGLTKMPPWWTPQTQYATVYVDTCTFSGPAAVAYRTLEEARTATVRTGNRRTITADLVTGEDVPA